MWLQVGMVDLARLPVALLASLVLAAAPGCAAETSDPAASEEDVASAARLEAIASSPALVAAVAAVSDDVTTVEVATFRYDTARTKDPSRALAAARAKLAHPRLRQDQGEASPAVVTSTLDEYGVSDVKLQKAVVDALRGAVGDAPVSQKLWLRSDDVAGSDSEWAEVVMTFVGTAGASRGLVVRLTIRYQA